MTKSNFSNLANMTDQTCNFTGGQDQTEGRNCMIYLLQRKTGHREQIDQGHIFHQIS